MATGDVVAAASAIYMCVKWYNRSRKDTGEKKLVQKQKVAVDGVVVNVFRKSRLVTLMVNQIGKHVLIRDNRCRPRLLF
jgi:hypothetical protein